MKLFSRDRDYAAFEQVIIEAQQKHPMRVLSYCLMPNHWHLALWPSDDGDLSRFMFWLTMTHVQRWRHFRGLVGLGPLYQGRFKAFPVETDRHFLTLNRYIERNPVRANMVKRAQDWHWSSLNLRQNETEGHRPVLANWPVDEPADWLDWVNLPQTDAELNEFRIRAKNGRPLGSPAWERKTAEQMGIIVNPRRRGRPKLNDA
jgi:putative transposase